MMFNFLSTRLSSLLRNIIVRNRLTENNIKEALHEVRNVLLEADVALLVVDDFINRVKEDVLGQKINSSLTPGQQFFKFVHSALIKTMGYKCNALNISGQLPSVILVIGAQGSGKTTTVVKLGKYLRKKKKKKVLLVSADVYRPAGIKQLEILACSENIDFLPAHYKQQPIDIVSQALIQTKLRFYDVLIVDTSGCLHVDRTLVTEIANMHTIIKPIETLFVVDAMIGQDAVNSANVFNKILPFTGIILTKMDSDTRGGAALSIPYITGKPIKFIGVGENIDNLDVFYPDRLAGRILGMGDLSSLVEDIESQIDSEPTNKFFSKLKQDKDFDLSDFLRQLKQMRNIGGVNKIISKLPNSNFITSGIKSKIDNTMFMRMEVIINSMTIKERMHPEIIKGSHKRRIAAGSGVKVQDINQLLKQFDDVKQMMKLINKNGMMKIMRKLQGKILS